MSDEGMQGRLHWYRPDELTDEQRAVYLAITTGPRASVKRISPLFDDEGRLHGPFNPMLFSPTLGAAMQSTGAAIRYHSTLSERQREIAILLMAHHERSNFEWIAHVDVGRAAGLTEPEIEALIHGSVATTFSAEESCVAELTLSLIARGDIDSDLFESATSVVGHVQIVEVIYLVGYYRSLAMSLRSLRIPLPPGSDAPWPEALLRA
ncbi:MAG: 4-carboxymuconolactone decarboxylase [Actinomycetota bacterium]|jgi:4-carboxymuconolactone decarboxylase|nr:4-carboxymuconolactone decarboxylase [Actinomycetota bacterium]